MASSQQVLNIPAFHMANVFGQFDTNLKLIESVLPVKISVREDGVKINGTVSGVKQGAMVLKELLAISNKGQTIGEQNVSYLLDVANEHNMDEIAKMSDTIICHTTMGKPVQPKTLGQKQYVDLIRDKMIVFGNGPAGTGKTYLAMAMAITAFQKEEVGRIILTRPAIEAGENL